MAARCDYCGHGKSYHTPEGCRWTGYIINDDGDIELCDCLEFTKIRNQEKYKDEDVE